MNVSEAQIGRPTAYKPEYVEQARQACENGATDVDLAELFDVSLTTIKTWKAKHSDFLAALKAGKEKADDRVERSLYEKATGYTFDAVKIFMPSNAEAPVYAPYREHVAPDTTAAIFWLKNRKPEQWRDKREHELTGKDGGAIKTEDVSGPDLARRIAFLLASGAADKKD